MARKQAERVLVIGLDSAAPQFVFGPQRFDLPNLQGLARAGCWGLLESCHPPITVPAWACMMSGKDPGILGVYGFRNRKDYTYTNLFTANSTAIREPRVWDILSARGKKVALIGVPQTYPVKAVNGWLAADFLAPDSTADFTYPKSLRGELAQSIGEYIFDVKDFRTEDKGPLLKRIYELMENRFAAARYMLERKPWDFLMMVEMGMDRIHHGFWKFTDPQHPLYVRGNPYENALRDYYRAVDERIGELLSRVGDETAVLVVSDHGAKRMVGGVCVNQWLINEGLLVVRDRLEGRKRIEDCDIEWSKTRAWSTGGYYARIFLNVVGREPQGTVPAEDYESFCARITAALIAMSGPDGKPLGNKVHRPRDLYRKVNGVAPDLIVYFGDLSWRSVGAVGFDSIYTFENDTGPDDANHDYHGIFIMDDRSGQGGREICGMQLTDVAPTVLDLLGVEPPPDMQGRVLTQGRIE